MKDEIEGLEGAYRIKPGTVTNFGFLPRQSIRLIRPHPFHAALDAKITSGGYPPVVHQLVFTQPKTGRKVLNHSPMFADSILECL